MKSVPINTRRIIKAKKELQAQLDVLVSKYTSDPRTLACKIMPPDEYSMYCALEDAVVVFGEIRSAGNF
jgi:hypothetical protein